LVSTTALNLDGRKALRSAPFDHVGDEPVAHTAWSRRVNIAMTFPRSAAESVSETIMPGRARSRA
jgi:hypothetical protein